MVESRTTVKSSSQNTCLHEETENGEVTGEDDKAGRRQDSGDNETIHQLGIVGLESIEGIGDGVARAATMVHQATGHIVHAVEALMAILGHHFTQCTIGDDVGKEGAATSGEGGLGFRGGRTRGSKGFVSVDTIIARKFQELGNDGLVLGGVDQRLGGTDNRLEIDNGAGGAFHLGLVGLDTDHLVGTITLDELPLGGVDGGAVRIVVLADRLERIHLELGGIVVGGGSADRRVGKDGGVGDDGGGNVCVVSGNELLERIHFVALEEALVQNVQVDVELGGVGGVGGAGGSTIRACRVGKD